jgi:aldehyde:ferredoxin oxidoreductase
MRGYAGKILSVDLSRRSWQEEAIPDEVYERHLSGIGLATYLLSRRIPTGASPLGPENVLGFFAGLLTGSGTLFSGRWLVAGKSPLTGGWGDANCGGDFGPAIKQCGYDGVLIQGVAEKPVTLFIDGVHVALRDASHLWGKDTAETEAALIAEVGMPGHAHIASIGPAGEKRSLISGICNDRGRMAARSGLGAVMGSKNLKALVLVGTLPVDCAAPLEIQRLSQACRAYLPRGDMHVPPRIFPLAKRVMTFGGRGSRLDGVVSLPPLHTWGTSSGNLVCVDNGDAPVKNWGGSRVDYHAAAISCDRLLARTRRKYHCSSCPLECGGICHVEGLAGETHRPEYETCIGFGPLVGNQDLTSIFTLNETLNRAGIDTISAAGTVAFAIECFENGLLTTRETDGLELTWGNTSAILQLVGEMVARRGIGDVLADGTRAAAARIGRGAEDYALHAGGQELPMHDPKQDPLYGLHYTVEPTPGRHTIGSRLIDEMLRLWKKVTWVPEMPSAYAMSSCFTATPEIGQASAGASMAKMVIDGAGVCNFGLQMGVDRFPLFEYLNAATGWEMSPDEYMQIGARVQTMRQLFNLREGLDPQQVRLPGRAYGDPPLKSGALKGIRFDDGALRREYWKAMGWDEHSGVPMDSTLARLGLTRERGAAG